ncbi:hypothetical protein DAPPUDRAFT_233614 [Daphnia pulex]|uniref:Uncharacterized protein n=1 Tax=Daphnia pulex TaxID=6669 RepID=E9FV96_DAPPU|nr:hypothetical protein DAPPUDRAFT_233614 [Daphnia pulex]|eukprot:EFX88520.1 hypothetical protein DAPPUDRAFT_233614 [Daphnia pulex]
MIMISNNVPPLQCMHEPIGWHIRPKGVGLQEHEQQEQQLSSVAPTTLDTFPPILSRSNGVQRAAAQSAAAEGAQQQTTTAISDGTPRPPPKLSCETRLANNIAQATA